MGGDAEEVYSLEHIDEILSSYDHVEKHEVYADKLYKDFSTETCRNNNEEVGHYSIPGDVFQDYLSATEEGSLSSSAHTDSEPERPENWDVLVDRYDAWADRAEPTANGRRLRKHARAAAEGLDVSAGALYRFSQEQTFDGNDGYWLAWIMEESSDDTFLLDDMSGVDFVGAWNTKTVLVDGDVGDTAGYEMRGGILCVKGEAGSEFGGWMERGTAIANEGVGNVPGRRMKGGELVVPDPGAVDVEGKGGRVAGLPRDAF